MSDKLKIQMTEEQAMNFFICNESIFRIPRKEFINQIRLTGFIIKSELQQKVEEAEELWDACFGYTNVSKLEIIQHEAIQLLKQSHPEFKK